MPEINLKFETQEVTVLLEIARSLLVSSNTLQLDQISQQITNLESKTMATLQEVLGAVQRNGLSLVSVVDAIRSENADFRILIENLEAGQQPSQAELEAALAALDAQDAEILSIRDGILQIVPTLPSPEVPTVPGEPLPQPEPTPESELPTTVEEIVITPSDEVGPEGTVAIDVVPPAEIPAPPAV